MKNIEHIDLIDELCDPNDDKCLFDGTKTNLGCKAYRDICYLVTTTIDNMLKFKDEEKK